MTKARIKGVDFKFHTHSASSECNINLASNNNEKQKTETKARMSKLNRNMKLKGFDTSDWLSNSNIIQGNEGERLKL